MSPRILIASALLLASPLAFSFTTFEGTCQHKEDFKMTSEDGTIEVKAKCDGLWSFSGYADITEDYADGDVSASTAGGHNCTSAFYGPWSELKKHKLECDGFDTEGNKTSINLEIKTIKPKEPK
jgi:hypothetical protein